MNDTEYYARRFNGALETIRDQRQALREARRFIWFLSAILTLVSFALGCVLAAHNFS